MSSLPETTIQETNLSKQESSQLLQQLRTLLGDDNVSAAAVDRLAACRDYWPMGTLWFLEGKAPALPDLVVWPRSTEEVAAVLTLARKHGVPVTPYGEGSGALGGVIPLRGGIVLDMKRMNRVRHLDRENLLVTVECGLNGALYEEYLNRQGFTGGHVPQSIRCSTVGGWLACRAAGQFSTRYGKIEDIVASLKAVLPDGTIFQGRPVPRSSTGPRLDHLFLGSEGTLGVITEAVLRIWPLPEKQALLSYAFATLEAALEAIRRVIHSGARPAVVRLYDYVETSHHFPETKEAEGRCMLVLISEGHSDIVAAEAKIIDAYAREHGAVACGPEPVKHWLERRFNVSLASTLFRQGAVVDTIEVSANWSNAASLYHAMQEALLKVEGTALASGHWSHVYPDGAALYFTLCGFPPGDKADYYKQLWEAAMTSCLALEGAISHHHGIGLHRGLWMDQEHGPGLEVLKRIKKALDPDGIMNPGKMGLEEALRWRK
ncbi:MAG TPA: FAD-binding oxidoreductase [Bacillota bacterium]|nr:FAD-binding oxidoreductase [Bacillota bacterium]